MNWNVDTIRGLVRPVITLLVVLALIAVMFYLVIKFADLELAKTVLPVFLGLVGPIIGFWFGQRTNTTPPADGGQ